MNPQAVVELRQYEMRPGKRDELIDLFERRFVESQEALGMTLIGQYRDLDDPDRFIWMRSFSSMEARKTALESFYDGEVWRANREAANATLLDNDNVLLLKPPAPTACFDLPSRRPFGADAPTGSLIVVTVQALDALPDHALAARFETQVRPALEIAGAQVVGWMVTEASPNTYPRLPVREGEPVLVWVGRFQDEAAHAHHLERAAGLDRIAPSRGATQRLRLTPTARSRLH